MAIALLWRVNQWRNDAHLYQNEKLAHSEDNKKCESDKLLTQGTQNALQKDRDAISAKLASLKLRSKNQCVQPSRTTDITCGGNQYARSDGNVVGTSDDFRDFAAQCETYRSERIQLEAFIAAERK